LKNFFRYFASRFCRSESIRAASRIFYFQSVILRPTIAAAQHPVLLAENRGLNRPFIPFWAVAHQPVTTSDLTGQVGRLDQYCLCTTAAPRGPTHPAR